MERLGEGIDNDSSLESLNLKTRTAVLSFTILFHSCAAIPGTKQPPERLHRSFGKQHKASF